MSFKRWYALTGEPVPLNMIPQVLRISPEEVIHAIRRGRLRVLTFRADNDKVYRMVPRVDLRLYGGNPLTQKQLVSAFRRLMAA